MNMPVILIEKAGWYVTRKANPPFGFAFYAGSSAISLASSVAAFAY